MGLSKVVILMRIITVKTTSSIKSRIKQVLNFYAMNFSMISVYVCMTTIIGKKHRNENWKIILWFRNHKILLNDMQKKPILYKDH